MGGPGDIEGVNAMTGGDPLYIVVANVGNSNGSYNLIVNKLVSNLNALGIFGFSFLEENLDKIQGEPINGVQPEFDNIASGKYPVSRPLFEAFGAACAAWAEGRRAVPMLKSA